MVRISTVTMKTADTYLLGPEQAVVVTENGTRLLAWFKLSASAVDRSFVTFRRTDD